MLATRSVAHADSRDEPPPAPGTCALAAVERSYSSAKALADRIEELADFLCGSLNAVQVTSQVSARAAVPGLLPELEERSAELAKALESAHDAITRIRNHLPS